MKQQQKRQQKNECCLDWHLQKSNISNRLNVHSTMIGEWLLSTLVCLLQKVLEAKDIDLVVDDCMYYMWSYFLKKV